MRELLVLICIVIVFCALIACLGEPCAICGMRSKPHDRGCAS